MYFRTRVDYEPETTTRHGNSAAEIISMIDDIADYLFENPVFRAEYDAAHPEEEYSGAYSDYCIFTAEDAVTAAEYNGVARVADLEIKAYPRRRRSAR